MLDIPFQKHGTDFDEFGRVSFEHIIPQSLPERAIQPKEPHWVYVEALCQQRYFKIRNNSLTGLNSAYSLLSQRMSV